MDQKEFDSKIATRLNTKEHDQLLAICSVSQAANSTLDLTQVLNIVMDTIIRLTGAERGFVMLLDDETGELLFKTARNMDRETLGGSSFQISLSIVNRVAAEARPVVTTNAQADPRFSMQESIVSYSLRSILCVPLLVKDRVIGVIYADSRIKSGLFSEHDLDVLVTFANQVASAIENAKLFESITMAKNLMESIFASIPSGVITTDMSDRISTVNRAAERILRLSPKGSIGASYQQVFGETLSPYLSPLIEETKCTNQSIIDYEITPELPDRGLVTLSLSLSQLTDANNGCQGVAIVIDDLTETKRLQAVREMFRRYVSPAVVDRLPADARDLRLGGHRQEVAILFADIRGFTSFSEGVAPEELVVILNQYLSLAAQCVLRYDGTLDKFMGDAVMALFNAPLPQEEFALNAIKGALAIREAVDRLHQERGPRFPCLQYGIGINVGEAVIGNVGTARQMNYTAIGDAVNLAKRLQEVASARQILLTHNTYARVAPFVHVQPLEPIQVKGRRSLEQIYELLGLRAINT